MYSEIITLKTPETGQTGQKGPPVSAEAAAQRFIEAGMVVGYSTDKTITLLVRLTERGGMPAFGFTHLTRPGTPPVFIRPSARGAILAAQERAEKDGLWLVVAADIQELLAVLTN